MSLNNEFETLLHDLEVARILDDELHERGAPLDERVASHEKLIALRAEIARARDQVRPGAPIASGGHDSRQRRTHSSH